ncbi:MAG TPA: expansin EXLX1 family cellulose-binding protein [Kofleriaceae bacterium]|nr:expansin EXLX1 family cellulose-binding protein [Kofleriaceae bacterium]
MRRPAAIAWALVAAAGGCSLVDAGGEPEAGGPCESVEAERGPVEATYDPTIMGGGNCTYGPSPDPMVVGVSAVDYDGSIGCGGCIEVERAGVGAVLVRVVDSCVGCEPGEVVLSADAFQMLEPDLEIGVIDVSWRWVECPVDGPVDIHFMEDSNELWLAIQVRNHRHRLRAVDARVSGADSWLSLARADYNYFIAADGLGPGPLDFRITDVYDHVVEESGMLVTGGALEAGSQQLPACD